MKRSRSTRKLKASEKYKFELQHVLGSTGKTSCSCSVDNNTGLIAYPAGCTVVLYDPLTQQQRHIISMIKKQVRSLHFSADGQLLVTGESGSKPCARIYSTSSLKQVCELPQSFTNEISCVKFTPDMKHIVGVGSEHDRAIHVWKFEKKEWVLVWKTKINQKNVESTAFSSDSSCCLMVGKRYIKILNLSSGASKRVTDRKSSFSSFLGTRYSLSSILLKDCKYENFYDVCFTCLDEKIAFAVGSKYIVKIDISKKSVVEYIRIPERGQFLNVFGTKMLVGFHSGKLRLYDCQTLELCSDVDFKTSDDEKKIRSSHLDANNKLLHIWYDDHKLETYSTQHMFTKPLELHSSIEGHSDALWDVKNINYESLEDKKSIKFATCSTDGRSMIWKYSNECCQLLHTTTCCKIPTMVEEPQLLNSNNVQSGNNQVDFDKNGFRSLAVSPDGKTMAIGDLVGNISIFDINSMQSVGDVIMRNLTSSVTTCGFYQSTRSWPSLLVCGGRDRVVQIFDCTENYKLLFTLTDHSSTVTGVELFELEEQVRLVTGSFDRSLHFYNLKWSGETKVWTLDRVNQRQIARNNTISSLVLTKDGQLFSSAGSCVYEFDMKSTELRRECSLDLKFSSIMCIAVNSDSTLIAAGSGKEGIFIYSLVSDRTLAVLLGHADHANSMYFHDDTTLVSAAGDSCLFVWSVSKLKLRIPSFYGDLSDKDVIFTPASRSSSPVESAFDEALVIQDFDDGKVNLAKKEDLKIEKPNSDLKAFADNNVATDVNQPLGKWAENLSKVEVCEAINKLEIHDTSSITLSSSCDNFQCSSLEQSPDRSEEFLINENQSYLEKIAIISSFPDEKSSETRSRRLEFASNEKSTKLLYENLESGNSNKPASNSASSSPSSDCNSIPEVEKNPPTLSACSVSTFNVEKPEKSGSQNSLSLPVISDGNSDSSVNALDDSLDEVDELESTVIYKGNSHAENNDLMSFTSDEEIDNNKTMTSDSSSMPPAFIELLKSLQSPKKKTQPVSSGVEVASSSAVEEPEAFNTANSSSDATFDVISASSNSSVASDNECEDWQTHCSELMSKFNKLQRLYKQHKLASLESSSNEEKSKVEEALHGISGCFATISTEISQLGIENTHQNSFQFEPLLREYSEKLIKAVQENKNFETT